MPTSNELVRDALLRHQIGLLRVAGSIKLELYALLDRDEPFIRDLLQRFLTEGMDVTDRRVAALERKLRDLRSHSFQGVRSLLDTRMGELVVNEAQHTADALQAAAVVTLGLVIPEEPLLLALVRTKPFQGRVLRDWASSLEEADIQRITDQLRIGLVQGETIPTITRRLIGTQVFNGEDGVTAKTRRQATAVTRTAVNFYSNQAKLILYRANADILKEEVYLATLDSRTTPICRSLDGKRFPVGIGPRPPRHFNCRSVRVPSLDGELLGKRPFKRSTEGQLVREYAAANGLAGTLRRRKALPFGHKGKFDAFARKRVRELTGQTAASTTYAQFLRDQTREFQDEVLGVTKAKLFRSGGLTLDKFVNRRGDELTLQQLAKKEKEAFLRAGLDPKEFL